MKTIVKTLSALFIVLSLSSCLNRKGEIKFDDSQPLSLEPGVEWVLITAPYVACHRNAGYEEAVVTHFKRGQILMVQGKKTIPVDESMETWYAFDEGWVPQSCLRVFSNKLKAQAAAREL